MRKNLKILFIGESCIVHTTEYKGTDNFSGTRYNESAVIMKQVIEKQGHEIHHIPCHRVHLDFPETMAELKEYDIIIISDVGASTMLLHPDTARFCKRTTNKLKQIAQFVKEGGAFMMVGGYMSFTGIDGKAKYKGTVIEKILPVTLEPYDDRVEVPEGAELSVKGKKHPILEDLPEQWPYILGYNKTRAKEGSEVIIEYEDDPIIALGRYGEGRTVAYTTDCAPHWAPPQMYEWKYYGILWDRIFQWLVKEI